MFCVFYASVVTTRPKRHGMNCSVRDLGALMQWM
jgi:hypothetical protein